MPQEKNGQKIPSWDIQETIGKRNPVRRMELAAPITELEVEAAIKDLPTNKPPGPDLAPNEVYKNCEPLVPELTKLYNHMIQWGYAPKAASKFYIVPLDKPGNGPRRCAKKRPIAL